MPTALVHHGAGGGVVSNSEELLPCPFCGAEAVIIAESPNGKYQIIGCNKLSMLCPNPRMVVYPADDGEFDYTYWNRRA